MTKSHHAAFWSTIATSTLLGLLGLQAFATTPTTRPSSRPSATNTRKQPSTKPSTTIADARQAAFQILMNRCGKCHIKSLKTAQVAALKVYNLDSQRWWRTIKDRQLVGIRDIFVHSSGFFSALEQEQIKRFVRMERHLRKPHKRPSPRR